MRPTIPQLHPILSRKALVSVCLILASYALLGMAQAPSQAKEPVAAKADARVETFLTGMEEVYETGRAYSFMPFIDTDFESRISFNNNLENYFDSRSNLSLYFVVDSVLTDKDKISVRLHWFRKSMDNSGAFSKVAGSSLLVFKSEGSILTLLDINGDNPFF